MRVLCCACVLSHSFGFLYCLDLAPVVRRRESPQAAPIDVGEEESVGLAVIGVAAATALHADKPKRFRLADGRGNGIMVHAVIHEILLRDREIAVFESAVIGVLNLDPRYYAMGR